MTAEGLFVDTGFFLALVNTRDEYHARAAEFSHRSLGPLLTTDAVLTEVANALSAVQWRPIASALVEGVRRDPQFTVVSVSTMLFEEALVLYSARKDKTWSLTDCISFVVMKQHALTEALAVDKDFGQAGFRPLLRDPE